jgi:hypothetical protein
MLIVTASPPDSPAGSVSHALLSAFGSPAAGALARKPRVAAMEKSKYFVVGVGKGAATKLDKLRTATVN